MIRLIRNALAIFCLFLALLFSALGVRSTWLWDNLLWRLSESKSLRLVSTPGILDFTSHGYGFAPLVVLDTSTAPVDRNVGFPDDYGKFPSKLWPQVMRWKSGAPPAEVHVPYWVLISSSVLLATILATKRRFSLRAMIVATTIVATVLGAVGAQSRHQAMRHELRQITISF